MFPVDTNSSFGDEVGVLGDHNPRLANRPLRDGIVGGSIRQRQDRNVDGIVPGAAEFLRQPAGQLCVDQQLHTASGSNRCTRLKRAA
jgi:hypothetical protein